MVRISHNIVWRCSQARPYVSLVDVESSRKTFSISSVRKPTFGDPSLNGFRVDLDLVADLIEGQAG